MGNDRNRHRRERNARSYARPKPSRKRRKRFLIVCEGEKTEPNYFRKFEAQKLVINVIGQGFNTHTLVQQALRIRAEKLAQGIKYQQVWIVMDRDSFSAQNFNSALQLAKANGLRMAYSNEAFELWYILHFDFFTSGVSRDIYQSMLDARIGQKYRKNEPNMYSQLLPRRPTAIENARRLLATYQKPNPEQDKPSTTVHLLVEQLIKNSR